MLKETNSYHNFAYYYNQLIPEYFYDDLVLMINKYGSFKNILDIACGSGSLCFKLKNDNNNVSGLDYSDEMLMIAQAKNYELKKGIKFYNQDMNNLNLPKEEYDLVTCSLDSLNYIITKNVEDLIMNVSKSLKKEGYFIFDVLTQFYIDNIVNDYYQSEKLDDFEYFWNVKKVDDDVIEHNLLIINDNEKYHELHLQYIHNLGYIEILLDRYDLTIVDIIEDFNELDDSHPSRIYYVVRKG